MRMPYRYSRQQFNPHDSADEQPLGTVRRRRRTRSRCVAALLGGLPHASIRRRCRARPPPRSDGSILGNRGESRRCGRRRHRGAILANFGSRRGPSRRAAENRRESGSRRENLMSCAIVMAVSAAERQKGIDASRLTDVLIGRIHDSEERPGDGACDIRRQTMGARESLGGWARRSRRSVQNEAMGAAETAATTHQCKSSVGVPPKKVGPANSGLTSCAAESIRESRIGRMDDCPATSAEFSSCSRKARLCAAGQ